MNPGPRLLRVALLPGQLTTGQQNRVITYLSERTGLSGDQLWSAFVRASKHAAADAAAYRHATPRQPLETRIAVLAAEVSTSLTIAAFALAYASGLSTGMDFGRSNLIRERSLANARRREREQQTGRPTFDPVAAQQQHTDAVRWAREMGRAARGSVRTRRLKGMAPPDRQLP